MQPRLLDAKTRVARARTHLIQDEPFFGNLLYRLRFVEDYSADTAWVDGISLGYNPRFIDTISDGELKGLLCHEVLHVAYGHCWRRKWRDPEYWNDSGDYAINLTVLDAGYLLPKGGLINEAFRGKPAELIYDIIEKPTPKKPRSGPPQQGSAQNGTPQPGGGQAGDPSGDKPEDKDTPAQGSGKSEDKKDSNTSQKAQGTQETSGDSPEASECTAGTQKQEGSGSGGQDPQDTSKDEDSENGTQDGKQGTRKSSSKTQDSKQNSDKTQKGKAALESPDTETAPKEMETSDKPFGRRAAGEVRDAPLSVDPTALEAEWKIAVQQAVAIATARGKLPGGIKAMVAEAMKPRLDWRAILRQFVQQAWTAVDYTWTVPSATYIPHGLYMPKLANETIPCIVIAIDTSASISDRLLAEFKAEVRSIVEELCPEEAYLIYCDAIVQAVLRFVANDPVVFQAIPGRGGTDFRPVFEKVEQEHIFPTCLVYLTDMNGVAPTVAPDYPVLWISPPTHFTAPWGEHVEMYD